MLPAEGHLTERLAGLRQMIQHLQRGNIERIEGLQKDFSRLPAEAKARTAKELQARYKEMKLDQRLERLDAAVAENERRIRQITRQSQEYTAAHAYRKLADLLQEAQKLQKHNSRLFALIDRTQKKLITLTRHAHSETKR